jgi:ATP-dependent phosphofructokinase / diphosphate-dependent phosphofructokinase
MKIGVLTSGGDTASLNAIIYGVGEKIGRQNRLIGFKRGWRGARNLDYAQLVDINPHIAGTVLKSSRESLDDPDKIATAVKNIESTVDGLIAIGGDDALSVGRRVLAQTEIPVCFVSKTIDNDVGRNMPLGEIDYERIINYFTSGFATAAVKAATYARELVSTSRSHERIMFLETMGRTPGWLALSTYMAKPDFILVPEVDLDFEHFKGKLDERYKEKGYAIVVVAEGVKYKGSDGPIVQDATIVDSFGHKQLGGVAEVLAKRIKEELKIDKVNANNPRHLYRCGISTSPDVEAGPSDFDRKTGIYLGRVAAMAVMNEQTGRLAVLQKLEKDIAARTLPLDDAVEIADSGAIIPRNLDLRFYNASTYSITDAGREYFKPIMSK